MINIVNKEDCVGCRGCVQICPKKCISFITDGQGFGYPEVDLDLCIHCGLCEKVCPVIHQAADRVPLKVVAGHIEDNRIKMASSSGGLFFTLAARIIEEGGVVFGARFNNNWEVIHDYAETLEDIKRFQGSKYTQSRMGDSYIKARQFLKQGRKVMFTGTPCQLAGLGLFLNHDYGPQLLKVDVVCHGVPSPLVWTDYLRYVSENNQSNVSDITDISFRDKRNGWEKYGCRIMFGKDGTKELYSPLRANIYMQGFLRDLYLRPACYKCPAKCGKSGSDITLGDFWRVSTLEPEAYSPSGTSLILINTSLGDDYMQSTGIRTWLTTYNKAITSNGSLIESAVYPRNYAEFWKEYATSGIFGLEHFIKKMRGNIIRRGLRYIKYLLKK